MRLIAGTDSRYGKDITRNRTQQLSVCSQLPS